MSDVRYDFVWAAVLSIRHISYVMLICVNGCFFAFESEAVNRNAGSVADQKKAVFLLFVTLQHLLAIEDCSVEQPHRKIISEVMRSGFRVSSYIRFNRLVNTFLNIT